MSELPCAGKRTCDFFNKEAMRIRGAVFYEEEINKAIEATDEISLHDESIYEYSAHKENVVDQIKEIYEKELKNCQIGKVVYEVNDAEVECTSKEVCNYVFDIKPVTAKYEEDSPVSIFSYFTEIEWWKVPFNKKKTDIDFEKITNKPYKDDMPLKKLSGKSIKFKPKAAKLTEEEKQKVKSDMEFEKHVKKYGVTICFKCIKMLKYYANIMDFVKNDDYPEKSYNILQEVGKYKNKHPMYAYFNSEKETIQVVVSKDDGKFFNIKRDAIQVALSKDGKTSKDQSSSFFIGYIDGSLQAISMNFEKTIAFRFINSKRLHSHQVDVSDTKKLYFDHELHWKYIADRLGDSKTGKVIKGKSVKFAKNSTDYDSMEGFNPIESKKNCNINYYLTSEGCSNSRYCCFYNCDVSNLSNLKIYKNYFHEILKCFEDKKFDKVTETRKILFEKFAVTDVGQGTYTFLVDNEAKKLKDSLDYFPEENLVLDEKIDELKRFEICEKYSKPVCLECLDSWDLFEKIIKTCAKEQILAITNLGVDSNNLPVSVLCARNGDVVHFKIFRVADYIDLSSLDYYIPYVFKYTGVLRSEYVLGMVGSRLCAINTNFKTYLPIHELAKLWPGLAVKKLNLSRLPKAAHAIINNITVHYDNLKKARFAEVTRCNKKTGSDTFAGVKTKKAHSHSKSSSVSESEPEKIEKDDFTLIE